MTTRTTAPGGKPRNIRRRLALWAGFTGLALLVPLTAMQFSAEVAWTAFDFAFAACMILGVGVLYELAALRGDGWFRAGVALALLASFLLVWINGAVGIIGDEDNPANLMFLGVILIALTGALVARLKPAGMAGAMLAAALAQASIALVVLGVGWDAGPEVWRSTAFFTGVWLLAAWLFDRARRRKLGA